MSLSARRDHVWRRWVVGTLERLSENLEGAEDEIFSLIRKINTPGVCRWRGALPGRPWHKDKRVAKHCD